MKRSDAIKLISSYFEQVTYPNIAIKKAEALLSKLEEAGMNPPPYNSEKYGWSYYIDGAVEWEPEE